MSGWVIVFFIVFVVLYGFYAIDLYLPKKKNLKYVISLCFLIVGLLGWLYIWFGSGWLIAGIVSTAFLVLSVISVSIAFLLDLGSKVKDKRKSTIN
ncbi:hypothetical protein [Neobacillus vireti]|uniref:YesK-like protein n=1 Tax=Neobacillus vireti LMG 21834 TaxID=1131730 RepID=A0AB94ITX7_9BACI|nr:hypothetical protein [Neobacillus vireti]ETI70418.1 hypothetical protein BAVI_02609 [Neobacillus vireti LMG 21834]KLT17810.1 hypothetical protein AA980_11990 [Neobacillus vireti]